MNSLAEQFWFLLVLSHLIELLIEPRTLVRRGWTSRKMDLRMFGIWDFQRFLAEIPADSGHKKCAAQTCPYMDISPLSWNI